jgi:hypothetical protein
MSSQKTKTRVNRIYKSAKHNTKRVANSHEAREIEARAKRTMINAKDGAKRIVSSQEVRGKGNDMMRSAKEFLGAVYDAARTENSKKAYKTRTVKKSRETNKKMKRKNN